MAERSNHELIEIEALQPGDVMLSRGDSGIAAGIVELDGGRYSHAALWTGTTLLESTLPTVRESELRDANKHALFIDVYRHREASLPKLQLVAHARQWLGAPYGTLNLGLTTLIIAMSSWAPGDWAEMNTLYGFARFSRLLRFIKSYQRATVTGRVTCVELIARAYLAVGQPIIVNLRGDRHFRGSSFLNAVHALAGRVVEESSRSPFEAFDLMHEAHWVEALKFDALQLPIRDQVADEGDVSELYDDWTQWSAALSSSRALGGEPTVPVELSRGFELSPDVIRAKNLAAGEDFAASLVTPRLFEESPDLICLGRLEVR
jgi:hypothetical protein